MQREVRHLPFRNRHHFRELRHRLLELIEFGAVLRENGFDVVGEGGFDILGRGEGAGLGVDEQASQRGEPGGVGGRLDLRFQI